MTQKNITPDDITENIEEQEMTDALDHRFIDYAFMTLKERALPDARDGLKPSQRRILVAMNDLGLTARGGTEKCAKISGDTSGNYHPHGEAIVYPTLVRLAQPFAMRETLLLSQGNFGNVDGDPPAAMRYTEAKLSLFGEAMLADLSPDVVQFVPNYNEKRTEPVVLPGMFPNLLVNGTQGIAVGWATLLPPHNYREVAKAIGAYIRNPQITVGELIKIMPGPDFPTGGKLLGQTGVLEYYQTGHGSIRLEGEWTIDKNPKGIQTITVTQLPYQSSPESLALEINALLEAQKIDGISDLVNLSSKAGGIKLVITIAKGGNADLVLNNLIKNTSLRKSMGVNQTVLIDDKVVPDASLVQLIGAFVAHRRIVLTNKYNAELKKNQDRIHILDGLISASSRIDEAIKLIRASSSTDEAMNSIIKAGIVATLAQAKAVISITLGQLTRLEADKLLLEKKEKEERVAWLQNVLANNSEIDKLIIKEQDELSKKIGSERKTKIVASAVDINNEELIKSEQLVISLTGDGYVKSTPVNSFREQRRGGRGVNNNDGKREDNIFELFESNSKELILFFTNKGLMFKKKAYEIPQASRIAKGMHTSNLLDLSEGEYVTNMIAIKSIQQDGYLVIATKHGLIKRSEIKEYDTSLRNAGLTAIRLNDNDQVAFVMTTEGNSDIFIVTKNGNCVRYSEDLLLPRGRATQGASALNIDSDDEIVQVIALDKTTDPDILVVTSGGYGKRSNSKEYRVSGGRNVKGCSVINKSSLTKNGHVVGACPIIDGDSLLVATCKGKVIRMDSNDIKATGRATNGVRVVKLEEEDCVSKVTKLQESEIEELALV